MPGLASRARVVATLRCLARKLGRTVQSKDLMADSALYEAVLHRFGSLDLARRAAGLPPPQPRRRWSRDAVAEIRRLHALGARISTWSLVRSGRRDLVNAARTYCGGIPEPARSRAFRSRPCGGRREAWSAECVLEQIIEREELGRSLAFTRVPRRLRGAAHYYFGSWCSAIEAAGLDYDAVRLLRVPYTRAALACELKALRKEQPAMTLAELHRHRLAEPCLREFAFLEAAARSAGLERWPVRRLRTLLGK